MITLVNPPNPPQAVSNKDTMGGLGQLYPSGTTICIPPLDIPYTAATLKANGLPVQVIDCLGSNLDLSELIMRLRHQETELVAIRTSAPTFDWDMRVSEIIKMATCLKIVVFGPYVALFPQKVLQQPFVDAIVLGEPELTFVDMAKEGKFDGCKGVWFREKGSVVQNGARKPIEDLDALPFPAWDLMPYDIYDGKGLMRNVKPFVTALTSRGCPYGCAYCPYPVTQGRKLRVRSPENVIDEMAWLTSKLHVRATLFRDPEFALQRRRVVGICEGMIKRGVKLAWRCETRIEDLDEELLVLMARAGCIGINMGIESADPQVLKGLNRKAVPLDESRRIIHTCKRVGIDTFCFFILGLPGEDRSSSLRTIDYAVRLNPTLAQFTVATPYPGTELRDWAEKRGYIEDDALPTMTSYTAMMRNEHLSVDQIRWLQWYAQEALAMRWSQVTRRILGGAKQTASEIKRWLDFQIEKFTQQA